MDKELNAYALVKEMKRGLLVLQAIKRGESPVNDYEIIDTNQSVKHLIHKDNEKFIGKRLSQVLPIKTQHFEILNQVMESGESNQVEFYIEELDQWLLLSIYRTHQSSLTILFDNITEKKRTEQKLIENEEMLNTTLELSGEGVWEWIIEEGTLHHNRRWGKIIGITDDKLTHPQSLYLDRIHPEDREWVQLNILNAIKHDKPFNLRYRMVHVITGATIYIEDTGVLIKDKDGQPVRMIGSLTDITHFIEAQNRLSIEKELFQATIQSVKDAIIATDMNGKITVMNPVVEHFTGFLRDEAIGRNVDDVFNRLYQDTRNVVCPFENEHSELRLKRYKKMLEEKSVVVTRSGEELTLDGSISPLRFPSGQLGGFVLVFRDITEEANYQSKIEYMSYHDELTGLFNRRYMLEAIQRFDKEEYLPFTFMTIDMNFLKLANDHYGHLTGNSLIQKTAEVLKRVLDQREIISRIGGDEFSVLLPNTTTEKAESIKQEIMEEAKLHDVQGVPVSVAIGYATKTKMEEDIVDIQVFSDDNMYAHKQEMHQKYNSKE